MNLPGLDGLAVTKRLKALAPEIAIIGMSVRDDDTIQQAMLAAGAAGFVTKENILIDLVPLIRKSMTQS